MTAPDAERSAPSAPQPDDIAHPAVPPGWLRRVVRVPLLQKLVAADLVINLVVLVVVQRAPAAYATEITFGALFSTLVLNALLVVWALRPLRLLESTALRVSRGDHEARVPPTPLADRNIARIGDTLNDLLDRLMADRARVRQLAAQVIGAGDAERAHIARELHDSTAQSLSALEFMLAAARRDPAAAAMHDRLTLMHEVAREALTEVRTLAQRVHPRVLDDLGLEAALEALARRTRERTGIMVHVETDVGVSVPPAVASVVYRVAQESVHNAVRHGAPREVRMSLVARPACVRLAVHDDGRGFDPEATSTERRGMGLFVMQERVMLVDGSLVVTSAPGLGTEVAAEIPLSDHAIAADAGEARPTVRGTEDVA